MSVHVLAPFLPDMADDPDFNLTDLESACEADFQRQRVIEQWLKGQASYEQVLDTMSDHGVDAYEWDDVIAGNIERLIATPSVVLDDVERILDDSFLRVA